MASAKYSHTALSVADGGKDGLRAQRHRALSCSTYTSMIMLLLLVPLLSHMRFKAPTSFLRHGRLPHGRAPGLLLFVRPNAPRLIATPVTPLRWNFVAGQEESRPYRVFAVVWRYSQRHRSSQDELPRCLVVRSECKCGMSMG